MQMMGPQVTVNRVSQQTCCWVSAEDEANKFAKTLVITACHIAIYYGCQFISV